MRKNYFFNKSFEAKLPYSVSLKNIFLGFFCRYQTQKDKLINSFLSEWIVPRT